MEALISGVPVIGTNNRGHREIIINGYNGFIIENDSKQLKEKVCFLYSNCEEYERIKSNCYSSSKKFHISESMKIVRRTYEL